jgi:hypothetical protein
VVDSYEGTMAVGISAADADFVANARADVPRLLAEVRRLREAVETLERLLVQSERVHAAPRRPREAAPV